MATATRAEYVTLGGLMMASKAIDCFDWSDLSKVAMRGDDLIVSDADFEVARPREQAPVRGVLPVRINGKWDHTTDASTGTSEAAWREGAWTAFGLLEAKAAVTTTQTVQLNRPGALSTLSADCQVLELNTEAQPAPWIWVCSLDVKLTTGRLS